MSTLEDKRDLLFRMLPRRSQYRESPFLPFETPEIVWLLLTLVGNRLITGSPRRKSPQTELSLLTRCKVNSPPGSSLFIGEWLATVLLEKPNGALMRRAPSLLSPRVAHPVENRRHAKRRSRSAQTSPHPSARRDLLTSPTSASELIMPEGTKFSPLPKLDYRTVGPRFLPKITSNPLSRTLARGLGGLLFIPK
ncbi:unnamed protein product [Prunus armeniaca]